MRHASASLTVPCCCPGTTLTFNSSNQNPVLTDTCGTWLLFNDLYGVTPFVDFCKVTGNICNEQGDPLLLQVVSCVTPAKAAGQCEAARKL